MQGVAHVENVEFMDLTDRENLEFRVSGLRELSSHLVERNLLKGDKHLAWSPKANDRGAL